MGAVSMRKERLTASERSERAEREENLSLGMAQPHRREFANPESPWLSTPLGRFCYRTWSSDHSLRSACFGAGNDYATEIRQSRVARGFFVEGVAVVPQGKGGCDGDLTLDAIRSAKAAIEAADAKVRRADEVLRGVFPRLPRAMERLCCSLDDPSPYDGGILQAGLWRLAGHYGLLDRGINSTKEF